MEEFDGFVERIDFNPTYEWPLVLLLKVGSSRKLLKPRVDSGDLGQLEPIIRLTQTGDAVTLRRTSGNYLKDFENGTLNSRRLLIT